MRLFRAAAVQSDSVPGTGSSVQVTRALDGQIVDTPILVADATNATAYRGPAGASRDLSAPAGLGSATILRCLANLGSGGVRKLPKGAQTDAGGTCPDVHLTLEPVLQTNPSLAPSPQGM